MKLTKKQINILSILCVVIIVMLAGIIFLPYFSGDVDAGTDPGETVVPQIHNKFRGPRSAFNENLFWETNIGSKGDDVAENVFAINSKIYIVAKAGQDNLDFEGSATKKAVITVISGNGTPLSYNFYDGTLIKSVLFNDGILIFTESEGKKFATHIDLDGKILLTKDLQIDSSSKIIDVIVDYVDNKFTLVLETTQSLPPAIKLKMVEISSTFTTLDSVVIAHTFDLHYIMAYQYGDGYILAANIESVNTGAMLIYEWKNSKTQNLNIYECSIVGRKFKVKKFVPYSGGFAAAIIDSNNVPDILLISTNFKPTGTVLLNLSESVGINLFCDNKYYYVHTFTAAGVGSMKRYSLSFTNGVDLTEFSFYSSVNSFRATPTDTYFAGKKPETSAMCVISSQGTVFQTTFASVTEIPSFIIPFDGYILVVAESRGTSIDVGKNFGGADIWIAKLRF